MFAKLRARLSYANITATLALFLALSTGGAYAANTIFSEDIVDGQVKTPDLGAGAVTNGRLGQSAVTSGKVFDNHLTGDDVKGDSLKGADIDEGSLVGGPGSPSGVAGGALTGSYPNPLIRSNAVGSNELAPEAVDASKIAPGAVGFGKLGQIGIEENSAPIPPNGGVGGVTVQCPAERPRALSGGARFAFPSGDLTASHGSLGNWSAEGQNNGNFEQNLTVKVLCIAP